MQTFVAANTTIEHSCCIGSNVLIGAGTVIAGVVTVGEDTWIGPNVTIRNRVKIGNKARVNIGAVVTKNVSDHESVTGNFAIPHEDFINNLRNNRKK